MKAIEIFIRNHCNRLIINSIRKEKINITHEQGKSNGKRSKGRPRKRTNIEQEDTMAIYVKSLISSLKCQKT